MTLRNFLHDIPHVTVAAFWMVTGVIVGQVCLRIKWTVPVARFVVRCFSRSCAQMEIIKPGSPDVISLRKGNDLHHAAVERRAKIEEEKKRARKSNKH